MNLETKVVLYGCVESVLMTRIELRGVRAGVEAEVPAQSSDEGWSVFRLFVFL